MERREFLFYSLSACQSSLAATPTSDEVFSSASAAETAIRKRQVSSAELTRHCLDRLQRYDSSLHAFVQVYAEWALAHAKEVDAALARNQIWGPLHGVPVSIKECFAYRETITSAGIPDLKDFRPKHNAVLVDRLEKGGSHYYWQDQYPIRPERQPVVQRCLPPDLKQPLRPDADPGRVYGRRCCGHCGGNRVSDIRFRHRRFHSSSRSFLRSVRP